MTDDEYQWERRLAWIAFAAAIIPTTASRTTREIEWNSEISAKIADSLLSMFDERFAPKPAPDLSDDREEATGK